ncbi:putative Beat-va [Daphnia magna]|uniref:Putative Beat-va n=1 Tax=Daphnia magna TaxID=35525 RepID=A0A0P5TUA0_9CRUS|nr:putative Beat-va [Daphnia magna]
MYQMYWTDCLCWRLIGINLILIVINFSAVDGLKLLQVSIPPLKLTGQTARLACHYDLEGDTLYSIKWYKGGREFFRYVQRDQPPMQVFPVEGVKVDKSQSDQFQVTLIHLTIASAGRYKCEVSVDAPSFQTSFNTVEMNVVALPEFGPRINTKGFFSFDSNVTLGNSAYRILKSDDNHHRSYHLHYSRQSITRGNDEIQINCTSSRSKPAAELHWYVNGFKLKGEHMIEYAPFIDDEASNSSTLLETSILGLRWKWMIASSNDNHQEMDAVITFNCTAAVGSVYWSSTALTLSPEPGVGAKSRPMLMYHGSHLSSNAIYVTSTAWPVAFLYGVVLASSSFCIHHG